MSGSARRGVSALALAGVLGLSLAACGAGSSAATSLVKPSNATGQIGDLKVRGGILIRGDQSSAALVVGIADEGTSGDVLQKVSVGTPTHTGDSASPAAGGKPVEASPDVEVPAGGAVYIGTAGESAVVLPGFTAPAGSAVPVTLSFRDAGELTLSMLVEAATGVYADYAPGATPPTLTAPPTSTVTPSPAPVEPAGE